MAPANATVTLENLTRQPLVLHLLHEVCCTELACLCVRQVVGVRAHHPVSGERRLVAKKRRLPSTITLLARGTPERGAFRSGLPLGVQRLEAVKRLAARGEVRVTVVPSAPQSPPTAPPPKPVKRPASPAPASLPALAQE